MGSVIFDDISCVISESNLTLLHSERPKHYGVLTVLSAIGLKSDAAQYAYLLRLNRGLVFSLCLF